MARAAALLSTAFLHSAALASGYECVLINGMQITASRDLGPVFPDSVKFCMPVPGPQAPVASSRLAGKEPKRLWATPVDNAWPETDVAVAAPARSPMLPGSVPPPDGQPFVDNRPMKPSEYDGLIVAASQRYGVDPDLVRSVVHVESAGRPQAVSHAGAIGLMQIIPATGRRYGVSNSADLFKPAINVDAGTRYLRDLLEMFKGRVDLAVAGYNAGEGAVIKYGWKTPPYKETQMYVKRVMARYHRHLGLRQGAANAQGGFAPGTAYTLN